VYMLARPWMSISFPIFFFLPSFFPMEQLADPRSELRPLLLPCHSKQWAPSRLHRQAAMATPSPYTSWATAVTIASNPYAPRPATSVYYLPTCLFRCWRHQFPYAARATAATA
jgi:hypothetical protein